VSQLKLREDALEWREAEGRVIALDLRASEYLALNATGTAVWTALADGAGREALVERLVERFDIDEASATRDLDGFLASLRERELLKEA
jgi:hypothetical protein